MNARELMGAADTIKSVASFSNSAVSRVQKDTNSGTPGSNAVKIKGIIPCVAQADAVQAEVRLYDRLFKYERPN